MKKHSPYDHDLYDDHKRSGGGSKLPSIGGSKLPPLKKGAGDSDKIKDISKAYKVNINNNALDILEKYKHLNKRYDVGGGNYKKKKYDNYKESPISGINGVKYSRAYDEIY
mmetsp:Transcript_11333/g.9727  ORF Transcript_11333/g.9727 Transcript_11333/m.9727 type:complete len:111 (+) Transcript_11333:1526-1858(+)